MYGSKTNQRERPDKMETGRGGRLEWGEKVCRDRGSDMDETESGNTADSDSEKQDIPHP